ncbi:hypothetical protein AVEN_144001-1 [Araneus ventricosus]|uniref:Uncharacterized protein n=1 Tax=Araneus ventricosus TaxID=182803 RepID=A0A4Y2N5V7_ARAVE|nr:hypothetical protein AVEN_144001-1 [Araneus ventricosus]
MESSLSFPEERHPNCQQMKELLFARKMHSGSRNRPSPSLCRMGGLRRDRARRVKDAMDSTEKLEHFFCQKNSEKTFIELNSIRNDVLNAHRQSARQSTVKDYLN